MPKPSHKERIIEEGMRVMHRRGFAGSSIRDIIHAAGVPQGSFTNHFPSKESFGVVVLDAYYARCSGLIDETLLNDALPPMARLRKWVDGMLGVMNQDQEWDGCMLGNFGADHSEGTDQLQERVREIFVDLHSKIAYCLRAAVKSGELPKGTDSEALAMLIHSSLEGAVLSAKAMKSRKPMEAYRRFLFAWLGSSAEEVGLQKGSTSRQRNATKVKAARGEV
ncbi:TetR family transcriptional regulator [Acidobacteria bacterium AB60]|nr:TetR family transcriptional regulator [Acidobacteria bacterium AB60]